MSLDALARHLYVVMDGYCNVVQERLRGGSISRRDSGRSRRSGGRLPARQRWPLWMKFASLFLGAFQGVSEDLICYLRIFHDTLAV